MSYRDQLLLQLDRLLGTSRMVDPGPGARWVWPLGHGVSFVLHHMMTRSLYHASVEGNHGEVSHEQTDSDGLRAAMTTLLLWHGSRNTPHPAQDTEAGAAFFRAAAAGRDKAARNILTTVLENSRIEDMIQALLHFQGRDAIVETVLDDVDPELLF